MNIYLDIDGVLIKKDNSPANYVVEFLKFITDKHDVYWLTTHCRGGGNNTLVHLKDKLPEEALKYLEKIKSTDWRTLKTEAIDFSKDFRWFDDYVMEAEKDILNKNNSSSKFILVDLKDEPDKLKEHLKNNRKKYELIPEV